MKRLINFSIILLALGFLTSITFAQTTNKAKVKNQFSKNLNSQNNFQKTNWVDIDGDGICDNVGQNNKRGNKQGMQKMRNAKSNFGDGSGLRPKDGTGFGKMNGAGNVIGDGTRTGVCDGTGTKGNGRRGGRN